MQVNTRKIKSIVGNGTTSPTIYATPNKRVFGFQLGLIYAGGTNTLAALMTALTAIVVKVGTIEKWNLTGTKLRDFMLLHGTTFDFNGLPNTGCQVTIPLAPEWFFASVQDGLAWNPQRLGGAISVELTSTAALTVVAREMTADNLDADSFGIMTLEVIKPIAASTSFVVEKEIEIRGRILSLSIYPDSGGSQEITPVSLYLGDNDVLHHEALTSAENDEALERMALTPAASGRTANIYDIVPVKNDMLARSIDLMLWKKAKLDIGAAVAMTGTCDILIARLEDR